jgi:hypothetical protein
MAVTAHVYPKFQESAVKKGVNLATDSLKVMLLSAYTFANSHATMADVKGSGTEASGTGYTAGGQALTSVTVSTSGTVTTFDCADPSWSASSIAAAFAVFYDAQGGTDSTNIPIAYWDFGGTQTSSSGTFTLTVNASGVATLTAA